MDDIARHLLGCIHAAVPFRVATGNDHAAMFWPFQRLNQLPLMTIHQPLCLVWRDKTVSVCWQLFQLIKALPRFPNQQHTTIDRKVAKRQRAKICNHKYFSPGCVLVVYNRRIKRRLVKSFHVLVRVTVMVVIFAEVMVRRMRLFRGWLKSSVSYSR